MKNQFGSLFLTTVLIIVLCCLFQSAAALGGDFIDTDIPVDGGLSILIAAGVGYGIKKLRDERKKKSIKL